MGAPHPHNLSVTRGPDQPDKEGVPPLHPGRGLRPLHPLLCLTAPSDIAPGVNCRVLAARAAVHTANMYTVPGESPGGFAAGRVAVWLAGYVD